MGSTGANLISEVSTRSEEEQQQEQNQRIQNVGEVEGQTSFDSEENSRARAEQSNTSTFSELELEKKRTSDILGVLGRAVLELHNAASKALDAVETRLQPDISLDSDSVDVLVRRLADLSTKIAQLKDVHSSLKGAAVSSSAK